MVPNAMSYQGVLTDANGNDVAPGAPENRNIEFRIYDAAAGGAVLWAEAQTVTVFKGNFSVILGNGTAIGAPSGAAAFAAVFTNATTPNLYFGITPQGGAEFAPRQQLLASAYALRARQAESVNATAQANGLPSQFNWLQANNLTVNGHTKIAGGNVLELGAGNSNKAPSAGQIVYQGFSNGLDIVGAGATVPERRITLFAEGGTEFKGPINFSGRFGQAVNLNDANNGLGVQNATVYTRSFENFAWFRRGAHSDGSLDAGPGGQRLAFLSAGGFNLDAGVFTGNGSGLTNISANALPNNFNYLGINGNNNLEFGRGVAGKQVSAGRIGYQSFSSGLDIVGAGTSGSNREIKLWSEGGLFITGPIFAESSMSVGGTITQTAHRPWVQSFGNHQVGSQDWTTYFRTAVGSSNTQGSFAWYRGGTHASGERAAGGGTALAFLDGNGLFLANGLTTTGSVFSNSRVIATGGVEIRSPGRPNWELVHQGGSGGDRLIYYFNGGVRLLVEATGSQNVGSDAKLKRDILPVVDGLDAVMKLRPTSYHYKTEDPGANRSYGFIAQEVQTVLPDLVSNMDADTLGLTYDGFIPVTIRAIQEQQTQIETLHTENAALQDRVSALEAKLEALLKRIP